VTRWSNDSIKVDHTIDVIRQVYEGPWGLKASDEDVVVEVARRVAGVNIERPESSELGERLWDWKCLVPSPLAEGLTSLIEDGLSVGATVPIDEIAGEADTVNWEIRQAHKVLDLIQEHVERSEPS